MMLMFSLENFMVDQFFSHEHIDNMCYGCRYGWMCVWVDVGLVWVWISPPTTTSHPHPPSPTPSPSRWRKMKSSVKTRRIRQNQQIPKLRF
jgi:hypothetical protein